MNKRMDIIHLLDDSSLGGVTKSLELFQHPLLRRYYLSSIEKVHPEWSLAPKYNAAVIVVHFSGSWKTMPFLYSLASRNPNAKLILVEHSYSREWEQFHVTEQGRFRSMLKLLHRIFDRVICVSEAQASWMKDAAGLTAPRLEIIHPWSDLQGLAGLSRPCFSPNDPITIGAYGRFVETKGFERLISVMNALGHQNDVRLRLGGFGPDEEKLKRLAGSNSSISFFGKIDRVVDFLDQCDIIAVPSKFEAYGLVATEARLAARPILVSNVGGLPEQVGDAGLIVDFEDKVAVVKLFERIRQLPLDKMSAAGREDCRMVTANRVGSWLVMLSRLEISEVRLKAA